MRTTKRTILILSILALCFVSIVAFSYANYLASIVDNDEPVFSISDDGLSVVEVSKLSDFLLYATDGNYNPSEQFSVASSRYTLKLGADLVLSENLFITADCHLDLNGFSIYLNGHSIMFDHAYAGSVVLSNGKIVVNETSSTENVTAFVPNAIFIVDQVSFINIENEVFEQSDYVEILSFDEKYATYDVLYMISRVLLNETDRVDSKLSWLELNNFVSNSDTSFDFSQVQFLTQNHSCLNHPTSNCCFVFGDLDLPTQYRGYSNVEICYASSNTTVLSNLGEVALPATSEQLTLTATVLIDEVEKASCTFNVHVCNLSNSQTSVDVAKILFETQLNDYFNEETSTYQFNHSITLPSILANASLSYQMLASDSSDVSNETIIFDDEIDFYTIIPDSNIAELVVTFENESASDDVNYNVEYLSSSKIENENTHAHELVANWYASLIIISSSTETDAVNGYSSILLHEASDDIADFDLQKISYILMNNVDGVYEISEIEGQNYLHVAQNKNPELVVQTVLLNVQFVFHEGLEEKMIEIQVPITYDSGESGEGSNISSFLAYYNYFNTMMSRRVSGITVSNFSMPFCYGVGVPVICFDFVGVENEELSLSLFYNGEEHPLTIAGEQTSHTQALDAHMQQSGETVSSIIAYGDAEWHFVVNTDNLTTKDVPVKITYWYKQSLSAPSWHNYFEESEQQSFSTVTLAGILRCKLSDGTIGENSAVKDENLYKWMYDNFTNDGTTYTVDSQDYLTKLVWASWLAKDVAFENDANALNIENYNGIQYLAGTTTVSITNQTDFDPSQLEYIAQMPVLNTLILTGNDLCETLDGTIAGDSSQLFENLSLSTSLRTLDVSNNSILSFALLEDVVSLSSVIVYSNTTSGANSIFYGSTGLANIAVFDKMVSNGVTVYNTIAGQTPLAYEASTEVNDYNFLKSIVYQEKLAMGIDISLVYAHLSTDIAEYGLSSSYTTVDGTTYTVNTATSTLQWSYVGDDPTTATKFTLTYNCRLTNGTTCVLVVEFDILRF